MIPQCISLVGKADSSSSCHHLYILPAHLFSSPCPEPCILILSLCQYKSLSGSEVNQTEDIICFKQLYKPSSHLLAERFLTWRSSLFRITRHHRVTLGHLQAGWGEEKETARNQTSQLYSQDKCWQTVISHIYLRYKYQNLPTDGSSVCSKMRMTTSVQVIITFPTTKFPALNGDPSLQKEPSKCPTSGRVEQQRLRSRTQQ